MRLLLLARLDSCVQCTCTCTVAGLVLYNIHVLLFVVHMYTCFSVQFSSSSGIAVQRRIWSDKGYTKEVTPVAVPPSVSIEIPPQQMVSVGNASERERETGGEGADTPRQLTSVSCLLKM